MLVPSLTHVVSTGQPMYFYYEVYEPAIVQSGSPRLLTSIAFFRGKVKTYETPLVEVTQPRRAGSQGGRSSSTPCPLPRSSRATTRARSLSSTTSPARSRFRGCRCWCGSSPPAREVATEPTEKTHHEGTEGESRGDARRDRSCCVTCCGTQSTDGARCSEPRSSLRACSTAATRQRRSSGSRLFSSCRLRHFGPSC